MTNALTRFQPSFIRRDKRGTFSEIINRGIWKNLSRGVMKKGAVIGGHYHKKSSVFFYVIEGKAMITWHTVGKEDPNRQLMKKGEGVFIPPYAHHSIKFLTKSEFLMGKSHKYLRNNFDTYSLS